MKTTFERVEEHYEEALEHFNYDQIVGCFLQGSQNYQLDLPGSDVDTKLIVVPKFRDIALNSKPVSTTHIRTNEEHIDFKDIRLYMETFRKQNLNFLEILFTPYSLVNCEYEQEWDRLEIAREQIARMNPWRAVKSMKGIALEKFHAMEHEYPSKVAVLERFGYDGKQVHHLLRVHDYLQRYIDGEEYASCLIPSDNIKQHLLDYKQQLIPLEQAREEAQKILTHTCEIADSFCEKTLDKEDEEMRALLEDVSYQILKIAVQKELGQSNFII